jgi:predicted MFS family arabinose efflux permease
LFTVSLGIASVAAPLLAVRAGYGAGTVGLLIALSAITQMGTRMILNILMRKLPDKALIAGSAAFMAGSCVLIALSPALPFFALSQMLQGVARACFWTGSQTHAVRVSKSSVKALAVLNLSTGTGLLVGPILAGLLSERSPQIALGWGGVLATLAILPAFTLLRLPLLPAINSIQGREAGRIWQRPGVDIACWMSITAGSWRGLVNS